MKPNKPNRDWVPFALFLAELATCCGLVIAFVVQGEQVYLAGAAFSLLFAYLIARREGWE